MNDYSRLNEIFSKYKDNEDLLFIKPDMTSSITNMCAFAIVNKKELRKNKEKRKASYYIEFHFQEKKKSSVLFFEILNYIKDNYNIENLTFTDKNALYCTEKMFDKLLTVSSPWLDEYTVSLLLYIKINVDDIMNFDFSCPIPFKKLKYWMKYNIFSTDVKLINLKFILKKYNRDIDSLNNSKKILEKKIKDAELYKEMFLESLGNETRLLLELSEGEK